MAGGTSMVTTAGIWLPAPEEPALDVFLDAGSRGARPVYIIQIQTHNISVRNTRLKHAGSYGISHSPPASLDYMSRGINGAEPLRIGFMPGPSVPWQYEVCLDYTSRGCICRHILPAGPQGPTGEGPL